MRLGLRIEVGTCRGALEGIPRLLEVLTRCQAGATFFVSLGPDRSGIAPHRLPALPGLPRHRLYGLRTLASGRWLPAPDIAGSAASVLRRLPAEGFEVGLASHDAAGWRARAARADAAWTERELTRGITRFNEVFECAPHVHGASGGQLNRHALRLEQRLGFTYGSDCRGTHPFIPVWQAEPVLCPQVPTTLPTVDELMAAEGLAAEDLVARLLEISAAPPPAGHVFTARAEIEGGPLLPQFEALLRGWRAQGQQPSPLQSILADLNAADLPHHEIALAPGRDT